MLSILSRALHTATRQDGWDAPDYWTSQRRPINRRQATQIEAERKLAQLRNIGQW